MWGGESKDNGVQYRSYEFDFGSWYNIAPAWNGNLYGGYARTYNFSRSYLSAYGWMGLRAEWKALSILEAGTSYDMFVERKPDGSLEDITFNARPYCSLTPMNDLNIRVYVDDVFLLSSRKDERIILGALISYNFLPKSWIYLAFNELQERPVPGDSPAGSRRVLQTTGRAAVTKVKYLYYF
jgi:hypothetical protein